MKNIITIKTPDKSHKLAVDNYFVLGGSGDEMHMMTSLNPEDLLIFLMPFLEKLDEIVNKGSLN